MRQGFKQVLERDEGLFLKLVDAANQFLHG